MNTTNLLNFGKYDYTINKSFYRNIALTTIFGSVGIAIMGFVSRLLEFKAAFAVASYTEGMTEDEAFDTIRLVSDPGNTPFTSTMIYIFCITMLCIFAGYTFHNLRNKQGRITELTMPASNLERWTWHVLIAVIGGFLVCVVSVLAADAVVAIANLVAYGTKIAHSHSLEVAKYAFILIGEDDATPFTRGAAGLVFNQPGFVFALRMAIFAMASSQIAAYIFGNSLKYKYNIILTYIVLQIVGLVFIIAVAALIGHIERYDIDIYAENGADIMINFMWATAAIHTALTALLLWGSYHLYCKAQITSRINK